MEVNKMNDELIRVENLAKIYRMGEIEVLRCAA
jgi:hypothetical protein